MSKAGTCSSCGAELPSDAPKGFCPRCLYRLGFDHALEPPLPEPHDEVDRPSGPAATPGFAKPRSFGDYELLEEIAYGGMGVVYKARQKSLDRIVALKLLLFGPHAPPESVKRFRAEAVATAALQHPNIVSIHEVGFCEGQHFIAMDYVEGQPLSALIRGSPLPARRAASYVETIAEAIHYAHERGILHRDLKPANVLIDANDQPRVTDFGLAKRLDDSQLSTLDSQLTITGQVLGSPNYMPPEQATGKRGTLSRRSDVYALGAILYHALTGRPPFVSEGLAETVQQVLNVEPVSPRVLNPSVPADLETVCLKCLEKEPGKRYATAQMLAEELGRFLEGKAVLARPVGRLAKTGRWCRRNPRLASAMGVALLSLLVGLAGVTWQWRRAEAEALLNRRNAYAADMKEVQRALEDSDLRHARELLNRHRPAPSTLNSQPSTDLRGWEWRYFWSRCQSDKHFTLCQYTNPVSALAFSPDGKWLAVHQEGGTVALWDAVARRLVSELPAQARVWRYCHRALAFAPQGNLLAWGNKDVSGTPGVSLRDMSTQKEARFPLSGDPLSLAFSPDAKAMATLAADGTVRVWDVESQQDVTPFLPAKDSINPDRLSAAAKVTATSAPDGTGGLREGESPQARILFTSFRGFTDHYGCVLFSPDGRWLAVGEAKPRIRLLDGATYKEKKVISVPPPADGISALAFSPDGRLLAAGCGAGDNAIHVWDLAADKELQQFVGHSGWIVGLAFSPDGKTLASASSDQTLCLWDLARQAEPRRFQGNVDEVWAVAWSTNGQDLVTGGRDGSVRYWNRAAKPAAAYAVLPAPIHFWGPAFFPDSKSFLTATLPEGAVVRWETASLQVLERLSFLGTNHTSLDLSKDGRWLVLGDATGNVQVWDFPARQPVTNLLIPEASIFALWFSPRGNLLAGAASPSDGGTAGKVWAVAGWREVDLHGMNVEHALDGAFAPNERTLAIGYGDGTAAWWDLATLQRQAFFDRQSSSFVHVAFSPDGRLFATGWVDGLITVRDTADRRAKPIGRSYRNALHDLAFSPDGRRLIASGTSPKGVMKLWDVETGRDVATLPGEPGWFCRIGFSPDGNTLFAASMEGTALFWRAPSLEEIEEIEKKRGAP